LVQWSKDCTNKNTVSITNIYSVEIKEMRILLSFLASAAVSFGINLLSNLAWEKQIQRGNKKKLHDIIALLKDFNRRYENTELDGLAFQKVIESAEISDLIFERIFKSYKKENSSLADFKLTISLNVIDKVNEYSRNYERPDVVNVQIFENYFSELIDTLIDIREDLLSFEESAQVSILSENIDSSKREILQGIEKQFQEMKEDNIFAEDKIDTIQNAINSYKFEEAGTFIDNALEAQISLSNSQREVLYYQRARILILTEDFSGLESIKKSITKINIDSKYITEIDFQIACKNNDLILFNKAIESFEKQGYSSERILLKKCYMDICNGDYEKVLTSILENGEIKIELKEYYETHSYYGVICSRKSDFVKASYEFKAAFELNNSILDKYNQTICQGRQILIHLESNIVHQDIIEKSQEIVGQLKELKYMTEYFPLETQRHYWIILAELILLIDSKQAAAEMENLPQSLKGEVIMEGYKSNVLLKAGRYEDSKSNLLKFWNETEANVSNLFSIFSMEENWEELLEWYKNIHDDDLKMNPNIKALYLNALTKIDGFNKTEDELLELIRSFPGEAFVYKITLKVALEQNAETLVNEIYENILVNLSIFNDYELERLGMLFLRFNLNEKCREILENRVANSELLLKLFIKTFDLSSERKQLLKFRKLIKSIVDQGCKFKSLLQFYILICFELKDFKGDVFSTLRDYQSLFGLDEFYARYTVALKMEVKDYKESLEDEIKYLLEKGVPQDLQLISRMKAHQGNWEEAEKLGIKSLYLLRNEINQDILKNHIGFYFSQLGKNSDEVNMEKPKVDSVTVLKSKNGIRKIAIHYNDSLYKVSGEIAFDCENYSMNDNLGIILTSLGQVGHSIDIGGESYEVVETIKLGTYLFRYCLDELNEKYPDPSFVKVLSSPSPEGLREQMIENLKEHKDHKEKQLALYNFSDNNLGAPISYLSGNDLNEYSNTLLQLFELKDQKYYAGIPNLISSPKYVLSISSIILLAHLELLPKLEKIKDKLIITKNLEDGVKTILRDLSSIVEDSVGTLNLTDDGNVFGNMYSADDLLKQRKFWIKILNFISHIDKTEIELENLGIYEIITGYVLYEDMLSIEVSRTNKYPLIIDDLFVRKISDTNEINIKTNNSIGFLFTEILLNLEDKVMLIEKLLIQGYLYPLNPQTLLDITREIYSNQENLIMYKDQLKEIYLTMFNERSISDYHGFIQELLKISQSTDSIILFDLLKGHLGL